jgi:hypothetical protein
VLLCVAAVLTASANQGSTLPQAPAGGPKSNKIGQAEIRIIVANALKQDGNELLVPRFKEDGNIVYYTTGGFPPPRDIASERVKLVFRYPVRAQCLVEGIRIARRPSELETMWRDGLKEIEEIISKELELIDAVNERDQEDLDIAEYALASHERKVKEIFERSLSKATGGKVSAESPTLEQRNKVHKITFQVPTKKGKPGRLFYLSVGEYQILDGLGKRELDNIQNWHEILESEKELVGNLYFRVTWPNSEPVTTGKVPITKSTTLTLPQ